MDLLVVNRRLDAIEQLWQCLFKIEQSNTLTAQMREEIVRSVVWLPDDTGKSVLQAVLTYESDQPAATSLQSVRELLLAHTRTEEEKDR